MSVDRFLPISLATKWCEWYHDPPQLHKVLIRLRCRLLREQNGVGSCLIEWVSKTVRDE